MLVALSSSAAPRATLAELLGGCERRGLSALHLVIGHAHGVAPAAPERVRAATALARDAGIRIAGVEVADWAECTPPSVAETCAALDAPFVWRSADGPEAPTHVRTALADAGIALVRGLELNAARENVATAMHAASAGSAIAHLTLRGGGPEAAQYEGQGIGTLMTHLALEGYRGVLALAPSSNAVLPVWRAWLQHGRKWGCGSKASDPALVQLLQ